MNKKEAFEAVLWIFAVACMAFWIILFILLAMAGEV